MIGVFVRGVVFRLRAFCYIIRIHVFYLGKCHCKLLKIWQGLFNAPLLDPGDEGFNPKFLKESR
jgi:hypothetical protein